MSSNVKRRPVLSACVLLTAAIAWGSFVPKAQATTLRMSTIEELTAASQVVITGRVDAVESVFSGEHIVTRVRVQVDERWWGAAPDTLELETPMGSVGEIRTRVAGADTYSVGDYVVLFAEQDGRGVWRSMALAWGCFKIVEGIATRSIEGLDFVNITEKGRVIPILYTPEEVTLPLEELRDRVKNAGVSH